MKIIILLVLLTAFLKGQDCVLVHGWLNDGDDWNGSGVKSLLQYEYQFNRILQPTLGGTSSASQQSLNLKNYLINNNVNNSLVVSHSMGGMTTRYHLKRQYDQSQSSRVAYHFAIGSPHTGALLASNSEDAIERILLTCEAALKPIGYLDENLGGFLEVYYKYDDAANYVAILTGSYFLNALLFHLTGPALYDLRVGSSATNYINYSPNTNYENNIAKVGIAGVEDYPEIYRTAASLFGISENIVLEIVDWLLLYKTLVLIGDYVAYMDFQTPQNLAALEESLATLAIVIEFPDAWNLLVTGSTNGESDGIVQKASQIYPNFDFQYYASGANHLQEKSNATVLQSLRSSLDIYNLGLTNVISVPYDYSTISQALSAALPGQIVNVINSQTLGSNITVQSGVTLNISFSATLNLNGHTVTRNGGSITVENGAVINGALLKTGGTVNTIFSSITAALNASSSGQTIEVLGSQPVFLSLSVQSGRTLALNSSAVLTFSSGKKISVYGGGTLNANGATFKGNGTAGNWHSISFFANSNGSIQNSTIKDALCGIYTTSNANVTVSNNTITNNSIYGLSIINNSHAIVSDNTISNNGTGINVSTSGITITGNTIENNTNYGINASNISSDLYWHDNTLKGNGYAMFLNNASPWIYNSLFTDNTHGIVISSSDPSFAAPPQVDSEMRGYNAITCNPATPNFKAENYSTVYAGYGYDGGYNSIFGSELPDMEAINHSGIYACNNYWGTYSSPQIYADGTSWILTWYPLSSDPNPGSSCMQKTSPSITKSVSEPSSDISEKYWQAIAEGRKGDFTSAKNLLKSIINGNYNNKYSPLALLAFYDFKSNSAKEDNSMKLEWSNIASNLYNLRENLLRPFAIRLLAREAALSNDTINMLIYNKEIVKNYPDSENELPALYDLAIYYAEFGNDLTKATQYFSRMKEAYPKEDLTKMAGINLGDKIDIKNFDNKGLASKSESLDKFKLDNAYPNPFNPTTTISYNLPVTSEVEITIYDILGNEVKSFFYSSQNAGNQKIIWNGRNGRGEQVSSGIYLYHFKAVSLEKDNEMFEKSAKLIMLK